MPPFYTSTRFSAVRVRRFAHSEPLRPVSPAVMSEPSLPAVIPLRLPDSDAPFVALRTLLATHGYTEAAVCSHAGCESIYDFRMRAHARSGTTPIERPMDVLVRLFMDSESLSAAHVDAQLGGEARELLTSLGVLESDPDDENCVVATVLLYPTEGPWIVSDRTVAIGSAKAVAISSLPQDAVYPAITSSVRVFLSTLPLEPVDAFLELCSGTGIAALMGAAGGAAHAYAVDITERSTVFAAFNARLNGLSQVTALQGDLWQPVHGMTFNTIVAHPPYVPAAEPEFIYRDGGEDGEQITRAILQGLHAHLAPGGVFHCTCLISSRAGQIPPHRVRAMLGEHSDAYDLLFLRNATTNLTEYFRQKLISGNVTEAARAVRQLKRFGELEVESVDFCTIVLRRHDAKRVGFTLSAERSGGTRWPQVAWALRIGAAGADQETMAATVLDSRVRLSPRARLTLTYRVGGAGEDAWTAERGRITVDVPFVSGVDVGTGDAMMLSRFDGQRTLREHLVELQQEDALPRDIDLLQFARSLSQLVLEGIIECEAYAV